MDSLDDIAGVPQIASRLLGTCPQCSDEIPESRLLIEYEARDGRQIYAECPGCLDVVHPV